ncbi:DUF4060 family protein, partial [Klebsiella pneumoniae]|uniref:DUF4060 family protein n=1 Tax=Klebsiella pneumoniae TaxID=573 RepID=UPI003EE1647D
MWLTHVFRFHVVQGDAALAKHVELYGAYGRQKTKRTYTVVVQGSKITVEVVNRKS